jgi:DNA-binding LacI/PurR family transcriptional regulator
VLSELERKGMQVPQDIVVIGFDDEMFSRWTYPKITTVSQPIAGMSKATVDYLIARIKTGEAKVLRQKFPVHLIVRESG